MAGTNPVGTWQDPNFQSGTGTVYKTAIDNAIKVGKRIADSFAPHEQPTPNMTVGLDAGYLFNDAGVLTEVAAQSTGTITAPTTNPRIDRVVVDRTTGVVSVVTGTEAASPTAPAIPFGKLPIAQVLLATSTTTITNQIITDERAIFPTTVQPPETLRQTFRGLRLETHPDNDQAAAKVMFSADEIVLDNGKRLTAWDQIVADLAASGANGLDTGSEVASTWYELYAIAKDDGTKGGLLHRAKNYFLDEQDGNNVVNQNLRDASARTKLAQGIQVSNTGPMPFVTLLLARQASPTGEVWVTIESDSSGSPSGTVLATSDKMNVADISSIAAHFLIFRFRTPATLTAATQYHVVLNGNFTISGTNYVNWNGNSANSYANGSAKQYDGASWSAASVAVDLAFQAWITQNDAAVTMPSGYTGKALLGYFFNNSGSNLSGSVGSGRRQEFAEARFFGTFTNSINMGLHDLSSLVPPIHVRVILSPANNTASTILILGGVPRGFGEVTFDSIIFPRQGLRVVIPMAAEYVSPVMFETDLQYIYARVSGGTGRYAVVGFEWE